EGLGPGGQRVEAEGGIRGWAGTGVDARAGAIGGGDRPERLGDGEHRAVERQRHDHGVGRDAGAVRRGERSYARDRHRRDAGGYGGRGGGGGGGGGAWGGVRGGRGRGREACGCVA